jgi:hypothetical protein
MYSRRMCRRLIRLRSRCPLVNEIIKGGGTSSIEALGTTSQYSAAGSAQVSANLNAVQELDNYNTAYYAKSNTN